MSYYSIRLFRYCTEDSEDSLFRPDSSGESRTAAAELSLLNCNLNSLTGLMQTGESLTAAAV